MGGSEQSVQRADIATEGFLGGRFFMPKGPVDYYSDEPVSDVVAYIETLK